MRLRFTVILAASAAICGFLRAGPPGASGAPQETAEPAKSARGGLLAESGSHQFEVFFYPTGLRVFPQNAKGEPVDASGVKGTATFYYPGVTRPWFVRPLHVVPTRLGAAPASLELVIDLSQVPGKGVKVTFELSGLPESQGAETSFTVPLQWSVAPTEATAAHAPPAQNRVTPSPRYVYRLGYSGYRYYAYPGPDSAPAQTNAVSVYNYGGSMDSGGSSDGIEANDWSTNRGIPLAKPWMRPND